jgi:hypothetical protein
LSSVMRSNVVVCGGPAAMMVDVAQRWRPVRTTYVLEA